MFHYRLINKPMIAPAAAFLAALALAAFLHSCTTTAITTPKEQGYTAGVAVYMVCERVALNKDQDFRDKLNTLWVAFQAIDSTETLATDIEALTGLSEKLMAEENLTDAEKALLLQLKTLVLNRLDSAVSGKVDESSAKWQFVMGVKEGIANMKALSTAQAE